MKKLYFLFIAISSFSLAQNTFTIKDLDNGNSTVVNNQVFTSTVSAFGNASQHLDIKNTSVTTHTYIMRKFENLINTINMSDKALAYFCFNTFCYGPEVTATTVILAPNESVSFYPKLDEASVVGESNVSYEFSDQANGSDILTMIFKYNGPVGLKEQQSFLEVVGSLYPNPTNANSRLEVSSLQEMNSVSLKIYNSLGAIASEKKIHLSKGKNYVEIQSNDLNSGIYIVTLGEGNSRISRKLTVNN